jgi:hypothetical protein
MPTPSSTNDQRLQSLIADRRYWDHAHPDRDAYVAYVTQQFRQAYPGPVNHTDMNSKLAPNGAQSQGGLIHVQAHTRNQDGHQVAVNDYYRSNPGTGGAHRMPSHLKPTQEPIRPSEYYRGLGFDPKGSNEREVAARHPLDALRARTMAENSIEEARTAYNNDEHSLTFGEGDAYRHGLWSYQMAKELGVDRAKEFGDAHEVSAVNNEGDRVKDLFNNAVGRELALDPANHSKPDSEVIRSAIRQGKFQIEPFSTPGPIQPMWGR